LVAIGVFQRHLMAVHFLRAFHAGRADDTWAAALACPHVAYCKAIGVSA
jgi:hypothetical protein